MSLALLQALTRSLSLRAKGLGGVAQAALTLVAASGTRRGVVGVARRSVAWEVLPVRCCSGHTTFRTHSGVIGTQEDEEDDTPRKALTPRPARPPLKVDLQNPASPDSFMLPSQHQRYQSDLLEAKIYECESADEALEVYQKHREVMDTRHCLALIRKLSDLVSTGSEESTSLLENEDFDILSSQLFVKCRRMEVDELVALLKYLGLLGVPSNTKLCQAVLQMLKNMINDLSLKQLIFLEFMLKKMMLTPLSDALLTAIPILISNALTTTPLTDLSLNDLSQAFAICCQGKVGGIGTLLQEMYNRGSVTSVSMAVSLVWTLTNLSSSRVLTKFLTPEEQLTRDVIMKECLETIAKNTDSLTQQQIDSTITKLSDGYSRRDRACYNERFLQAAVSHSCRSYASFECVSHMLRKMMKMSYLSDELVQYVVRLIISKPQDIPEARTGMLPILSAIAVTPSLPKHDLKEALDVIMTHKSLQMNLEDYYKKPLVVIAIDLLSAGYFHPPLMNLLTSPDTLSMFMSKYPKDDTNHRRLAMVDLALEKVFQSRCRVPEPFLEPGRKLLASQPPTRSSLKSMLHQILRDPNCLISGVTVGGAVYIDHMLALDPEGVPMKLWSADATLMNNPSIDSLDVPPEATMVAILDIGSSMVFRPSNTLRSQQRLRQIILESAGFRVLPMLQSLIFQHRDEEKLLYVKRELMSGAGVALS